MTRRALLIGSQTGGLTGVHADVELMRATLGSLGFTTDVRTEKRATREGILRAYRELAERTAPGDTVLVYYSGHGSRYRNPGAGSPQYVQFIVPTDFDDAAPGEFCGILAEELSLLQAGLTARTADVTTVLDCCHSARMSRRSDALPRARETRDVSLEALRAVYQAVLDAPGFDRVQADSNPEAVRVVACAPEQSAFELDLPDGSRHGALTYTLAGLLSGDPAFRLTWRQLLEALRPAVMSLVEVQRPDIEGPADRYPFTTRQRSATGVLPVSVEAGEMYLPAPAVFGIAEGDTYGLVAAGADAATPLATVVVAEVRDGRARLTLTGGDLAGKSSGLEAHPVRTTLDRRPVAVVPASHPEAARVTRLLGASPHVRLTAPDTPGLLATVELSEAGLRLLDAAGEPLNQGYRSFTDDYLTKLGRDVLRLARAAHLRDLSSGTGSAALDDGVTFEYTRLGDGETPVSSGEHLFDGDHLVVRLRNTGDETRYVSVFDIGLRGAVELQSTAEAGGLTLAPGDVYAINFGRPGQTGIELYWPDGLPRTGPRPESFVTIVTDRRQDLRALNQAGVARAPGQPASALEELVDAVVSGTRDGRTQQATGETVRYRVARFDFFLHPARRNDDEPAFELDERPDPSFRLVVPRTAVTAPSSVAVRLPEVVVHSNRALLGSRVRIDSMVLTRLDGRDGSPYQAATARFDRVHDGDRLPLDNFLIYDGPVSGFLDIALWVAKDDQREVDLADLLRDELNRDDVKAALTALAGLAIAAPQAVLAVGAVAAVATLVRTGAALLDRAVGKSIGIYRTSLLPHERFGAGDPAGRHPPSGLLRAQDMSFALEVVGS